MVLIFSGVISLVLVALGCAASITRGNEMSEVFYTPPEADLRDQQREPAFFTVAPTKLVIMLIVTSGLYGLYWFFKNWTLYKAYSARSIWPLPRTVFGILYLPSMFCKIDAELKKLGKEGMSYWRLSAAGIILIALGPVVFSFFSGLIQGLQGQPFSGPGPALLIALSISPVLAQSLILRRVQSFINLLNDDPAGAQNNSFTALNAVWALIGIGYWYVGLQFTLSMANSLQ